MAHGGTGPGQHNPVARAVIGADVTMEQVCHVVAVALPAGFVVANYANSRLSTLGCAVTGLGFLARGVYRGVNGNTDGATRDLKVGGICTFLAASSFVRSFVCDPSSGPGPTA